MTITPTEAADIARRHGLTLNDAAGLLQLADDAEGAETIAARFATNDADQAVKDYARELFGVKEPTPADEVPKPAGHAAGEGTNPSAEPDGDRTIRRFVAQLFNTPDQDTI